ERAGEQVAVGFDKVEGADKVVVDVAEIVVEVVVDDTLLAAQHGVDQLTHLAGDAAEGEERALEVEDAAQHLWLRVFEDFALNVRDLFRDAVENGEIFVDDGVGEHVGDAVEAGDALVGDFLSDVSDEVVFAGVHGDDEVASEKDAEVAEAK